MPHDLINRLVFEIELNCNENEAKAESDMLFEQHILSALDRVLARYSHIDATLPDTIEIDLGTVAKIDLGDKLENALTRLIEQHIHNIHNKTNHTEKKESLSASQTFLDYLRRPLIPWDSDDVAAFDRATLVQQAIEEAVRSESYFRQLLSAISSDIAMCRRFFDISFEQPHFSDIVAKIASSVNDSDSCVVTDKFNILLSSFEANPQIFRDISYYIISNLLFTHQQNNTNTILLAAAILVESGAVPKAYIFNLLGNNADTYEQPFQSQSSTHSHKNVLSISKEDKGKLEDSIINRQASNSDLSVSNKPISPTNKAIVEQLPHNNGTASNETSSLLSTQENNYNSSQSSRIPENGDLRKNTETSDWHEATQLIALIDKISQSSQIITSEIEQAEETLSLLIAKINLLSLDKTDDNKRSISDLKTKSGRLSIGDIIKIAKTIGNTAIEQEQQANDRKQRLSQKIAYAIGKQPHLAERIPLYNAGLVLYNPFLISFFDRLELLENRRQFRSVEHQFRAVHLLQELSGEGKAHLEHLLPLNKLLCGVNMLFPVGEEFTPTDKERNEIESLSKALIANWTIIKNSSVAGFRESFVRRRGVLERSDKDWILRVETKGIDILLDDIPWNIHLISLPWNDYLIHVDWKL